MKVCILSWIVVSLLFFQAHVYAQIAPVPDAINFQGRLTKPDGTPVPNGNYSLRFSLWSAATGGTERWHQVIAPASVHNGTFAALLTGFPATLFQENLWLEIQVETDAPLAPRQRLTTTPYAMKANSVADGAITGNSLANNSITGDKIAANSITGDKLALGALTFANIGGTLLPNQLANGSVTVAKLEAQLQAVFGKFDTASSGTPVLVGSITTNTAPNAVAIAGTFAYVVNFSSNTLQVFNISNPSTPIVVGSVATQTSPSSITVVDNYAYVTAQSADKLQIFDISTPTAPVLVGNATTDDVPVFVTIAGNYAYVICATSARFQIFDISAPTAPVLVGSVSTLSSPRHVAIAGNYAYVVATGASKLQVFNITNRAAPAAVGSVTTDVSPRAVIVKDNCAYVINYQSNTLQVFDISNPVTPSPAGSAPTGRGPVAISISTDKLFVVNGNINALQVFDISSPNSPTSLASATTGNTPQGVAVSGGTAYVVNYFGNSLQIFDTDALRVKGNLILNRDLAVVGGGSFGSGLLITNGNVGIGTSTPAYKLHVNGSVAGVGNFVSLSDARYKQNVSTIENALEVILHLRGVTYDWRQSEYKELNFSEGRQIGFIAQEVERVLPELVQTDRNGYKSVAYANMVPVLVEAIKQQQKQMDALKARNMELEARLKRMEALESRLETLERSLGAQVK
jgi:hypothetical protein